jgi:uncharacterized membrane protein
MNLLRCKFQFIGFQKRKFVFRIKKIYLIIRSNWLALTFALLICLITIIAVPIIYSIDKSVNQSIRFENKISINIC